MNRMEVKVKPHTSDWERESQNDDTTVYDITSVKE